MIAASTSLVATGRGVGAHAAGIGAGIAVADPLVILRRDQRQRMRAIHQREEAELLAVEKFLDHDLRRGLAELRPLQHRVDLGLGFGEARADDDALAGGETVRLDDDRRGELVGESLRLGGIGEAGIARGRDAVFRGDVFHEALGAFKLGGFRAGSEGGDAGGFEAVGQAFHQ